MRFSGLTERLGGTGADAWEVHYQAMTRLEAGEEIFLLSVGQETDSRSPPGAVAAAITSIEAGRHHYTPVEGEADLRQAIADYHRGYTGQAVSASQVTVFSGAQNALFAIAQVLLEPGDEVIILEPYYVTYPATFSASGATLVPVPLRAADGFALDVDLIVSALTARTRAVVVNSPNNPTGAIYGARELTELLKVCQEREIWLISDEVYAAVVDPEAVCSPSSLSGGAERSITISSISKSHRMTGWRIGWAIGPPEISKHLYNLNMCMSYGLPGFTQDAATHALREEGQVLQAVAASMRSRRQAIIAGLEDTPGIRVIPGGGGMFLMVDISALGLNSQEFARGLLDCEAVAVLPGDGFGVSCRGFIRISAVLPVDRLEEACRRIDRFVRSLLERDS